MLSTLPNELLFSIFKFLDNGDLYNLARTCHFLYPLLIPQYYKNITLKEHCVWSVSSFAHTIFSNPTLAENVQSITFPSWQRPCFAIHSSGGKSPHIKYDPAILSPIIESASLSAQEEDEWNHQLQTPNLNAWVALLLPRLPNLVKVDLPTSVGHTMQDRLFQRTSKKQKPFHPDSDPFMHLQEVSRNWRRWVQPFDSVSAESVLPIMLFSSMRRFTYIADRLTPSGVPLDGCAGQSSITDLDIRVQECEGGIEDFVALCGKLESFSCVVKGGWGSVDSDVLANQRGSLQKVRILSRANVTEGGSQFAGSWADFPILKELHLRAPNLLDPSIGQHSSNLISLFPASLESLKIDDFQPTDISWLTALLKDLSGDRSRLPVLSSIEVGGVFCDTMHPDHVSTPRVVYEDNPFDESLIASENRGRIESLARAAREAGVAFRALYPVVDASLYEDPR